MRRSLLVGAAQAEGVAVVIDVLRAFTTAAYMAHLGADKIYLVADAGEVLRLKEGRGYLAVGEVDGRAPPGFDLGNSPSGVMAAGRELFAGRTVAQRTTAGTSGAVAAAQKAKVIILGSFVTAQATAWFLHGLEPLPGIVSLVAMGEDGVEIGPDDEACADYIEHLLTGRPYDHTLALQQILRHECGQRFLRGDQPHFPREDLVYALQRDLFGFVLVARLEEGRLVARRVAVSGGQMA